MHEMPYTQAILEMAVKEAKDRPVKAIFLRVGALSAVVPESVAYFFNILGKDTLAQGAKLVFEMAPITLTCGNCRQTTTLEDNTGIPPRQALSAAFAKGCPCGKTDFKVTGGLGFDMTGIEV